MWPSSSYRYRINMQAGGVYTTTISVLLLLLPVSCLLPLSDGAETARDYCATHNYKVDAGVSSNVMQFTKELVTHEYAIVNEYKSLHCCAKGYQSIEWFMNGQPQPWSPDTSRLIIDTRAENQTIFVFNIGYSDAGNYTCVLRNATHKSEHRIELKVIADTPETPLATYRPHDVSVGLEQPIRLFCEAFVGKVQQQQADERALGPTVTWSQVFDGEHSAITDGVQVNVNREDNQIVGAYLLIEHMQTHNYGRYACRIDSAGRGGLEMAVPIVGPPTKANDLFWSLTPLQMSLCGVLLLCGVLVLLRYALGWYALWRKRGAVNQHPTCPMRALLGRSSVRSGNNGNGTSSADGSGRCDGGGTHKTQEKLMAFRHNMV